MSAFEKLGVISEIIQAIQDPNLDWLLPTNVQDEAIPLILGGGDVMVAAETGSGKTAAFAIPILQVVYETLRGEGGTGPARKKGGRGGSKSAMSASDTDPIPPVKFSAVDKMDMFVIEDDMDGLSASSRAGWQGGRANIGVNQGAFYYEVQIVHGLCRVGWATRAGDLDIGKDNLSWGYGGTAKAAYDGQFDNYGERYGDSDVIGVYVDFKSGEIGYSKNGIHMGVAHYIRKGVWKDALFPAIITKNGRVNVNFGASPFLYKMPRKGLRGLQSAKIGETSVKYGLMARSAAAAGSSDSGGYGGARGARGGSGKSEPLALVLAPTRDLATQLFKDFNKLSKYLREPPVKCVLTIGGMSHMVSDIKSSQIVIGSVGSICGLIESRKMSLNSCKFFVIDEADRVLDGKQGHMGDVKALYSRMPHGVQVMLFSATLHSDDIKETSKIICKHPQWVDLKGREYVPDTVHHCILPVDPVNDLSWVDGEDFELPGKKRRSGGRGGGRGGGEMGNLLDYISTDGVHERDRITYPRRRGERLSQESISEGIKLLKPIMLKRVIDSFKIEMALIFCRTRLDCDNMYEYMTSIGGGRQWDGCDDIGGKENPYSCVVLHSGKQQGQRERHLEGFKKGNIRFLICTDVAARGIDIKNLPFVINVTMPAESEDYIHRVGRVGRADMSGMAISLVSTHKEKVWYHANCHPSHKRGVGCTKTHLVKQGGCCIWYDEVDIFSQVERRLGGIKIPKLDSKDLSPKKLSMIKEQMERKDPLVAAAYQKIEQLKPRVLELTQLERDCQNQWLEMPHRFQGIFA